MNSGTGSDEFSGGWFIPCHRHSNDATEELKDCVKTMAELEDFVKSAVIEVCTIHHDHEAANNLELIFSGMQT